MLRNFAIFGSYNLSKSVALGWCSLPCVLQSKRFSVSHLLWMSFYELTFDRTMLQTDDWTLNHKDVETSDGCWCNPHAEGAQKAQDFFEGHELTMFANLDKMVANCRVECKNTLSTFDWVARSLKNAILKTFQGHRVNHLLEPLHLPSDFRLHS